MAKLINGIGKMNSKKWALGCGIFILLCGGGVVVAALQVVDFPIVANEAQKVQKQYQAAGLPWEQADLNTALPDADNGVSAFLEAEKLAGGNLLKEEKVVQSAIRAEKWAEAESLLREIAAVINLLRKSTQYKGFDFKRDWDKGARLQFPEYAVSKAAVRLLTYQALISARKGDIDSALLDLRAAYQMGNMFAGEPTIIAMLVAIADQSITLDAALRVAAVRPNDVAWLGRVRKEVEQWKCAIDFPRSMEGEAYIGLSTIRNLRGNPLKSARDISSGDASDEVYNDDEHIVRTGLPKGMIGTSFAVRWMEAHIYFKKEIKASDGNWTGVSRKFDEYSIELNKPPFKASQTLNRIMFPVFVQAGVAADGAVFRLDAVRGVLLAAEYKVKHGKYPKDFAELGFEVVDTVNGTEAIYKVKGNTLLIYSVGGNGVDEGGIRTDGSRGDDYVIQFPPLPRK